MSALNTEIVELSKRRKELEQNQKNAAECLDKERKQIEDKVSDNCADLQVYKFTFIAQVQHPHECLLGSCLFPHTEFLFSSQALL